MQPMVDVNSPFPSVLKNPSGKQLFILLALLLGGFTLLLSKMTGVAIFAPLWGSALLSAMLGFWVIPVLQRLKTGQIVQEDGPQSHLKKAGTPTMGGIFFVPVAIALALMFTQFTPAVMAVCLVTFAYGLIGWVDDWQVLRLRSNKGLSPRMKLILQVGVAIAFCVWLIFTQPESLTTVNLFWGIAIPFGILFWPLAVFVMVAESNATNLTDGVDGLAAGTGAIALLGLGAIIAQTSPELTIFCACLSGGCLGFVFHNRNPAKVFMGDTGSLALGGALAAVGILGGQLWGLFIVSGLFFVESLSVIAQVSYYKATKRPDGKGKRLFKMAPIHHHFELSGWKETQVVGTFYLLSALLSAIAIACL